MPGAWHGDLTSTQGLGPRSALKPDQSPDPGVGRPTLTGALGASSGKPQVFACPGAAATARSPYPRRPRRQGTQCSHIVQPPAGCSRRPAGAKNSEPGLSASSPAAHLPAPTPAGAALRLTRSSSRESLAAAAARLLGTVATAAGVAGARGGGRGGGAAERHAHHQPQGTLLRPASNAAPRICDGTLRWARGQGQVGNLETALRHCLRMLTRGHAEPQTRSQYKEEQTGCFANSTTGGRRKTREGPVKK